MNKYFLIPFFLIFSNSAFCQIEWVSDEYDSQYPNKLYKTLTGQFILLHGLYESSPTKMSVFDNTGNLVCNLDANGSFDTYQIQHFEDVIQMRDSSLAILLENWYIDTLSGWSGTYTSILKLNQWWYPTQVYGTILSTENRVEATSDGSFILMSTQDGAISLLESGSGLIWTEWLNNTCYDMLVTEDDIIIIATEEGLLEMNIDGDIIGENPNHIFTKMRIADNGNIVGVNENSLSIISPQYELLFDTTLSTNDIKDFHLEGDTILVLADSGHVFLLNDSLHLLNSFQLFDDGQFDFISINSDKVILAGTERYGGEEEYYQTRSTFLKEYSFTGNDYNLSNDIGVVEVGNANETIVTQTSPDSYRILFREIPLLIKNFGDKSVDNLILRTYTNAPKIVTDFSLQPGEIKEFVWDEVKRSAFIDHPSGNIYDLCFWTSHPDSLMDLDADNDLLCSGFLVNNNEIFFDENITIFPNPLKGDFLDIKVNDNHIKASLRKILLFDAMGRKILEEPFSNSIDLSRVRDGFYFVKLINKNKEVIHLEKIVIQE